MLDKLVTFIINQINHILPIYFIYEYQLGIRFWCGRFQNIITPGIWFKIPYLHTMMRENSVDTTILLPAQSVITLDEKELIVKGSIGYKIIDIKKFFLNVYDTTSALSDRTCIIIKDVISLSTFKECKDIDLKEIFLRRVQIEVEPYGIKVQYVALLDITNSRSYRLFNETNII